MSDLLRLAWGDFLTLFMVIVRVGMVFAVVPFFSAEVIPRRVTAVLALFLSMVLMPVVPRVPVGIDELDALTLLVMVIQQLLVGIALGLAVNVIFAGVQIAGELMGFQMGFSIANVVDPMTGVTAPITSNLLYVTAFLLFFALGGHHQLIKGLFESFAIVPASGVLAREGFFTSTLAYASEMFVLGVKAASPVVGVLLLVNVAFAVLARAVPQMNVFLMAFPITIAVGLVFLAVVVMMLPGLMEASLQKAQAFMNAVLALY
ncbi:MAG TPA: flagellar biosynthetic protein FliR [Deltaproteobacteria bacterium]|nr:flagellar biosynthetic protein FliR [Deltaproteobacteria bacterium]HOM30109.1 flagellar biosynthetic protein FliR [Deltaproteobacteria bacterium]HPP79870.1 flagellar biosynthetic protein FliR [Deltaproteobacteria bacterium]